MIQINASINPATPARLLNINGELIGINASRRAQGLLAVSPPRFRHVNRHLSSLKVANVRHGLTCGKLVEEASVRQRLVVASGAKPRPPTRGAPGAT